MKITGVSAADFYLGGLVCVSVGACVGRAESVSFVGSCLTWDTG